MQSFDILCNIAIIKGVATVVGNGRLVPPIFNNILNIRKVMSHKIVLVVINQINHNPCTNRVFDIRNRTVSKACDAKVAIHFAFIQNKRHRAARFGKNAKYLAKLHICWRI